VVCLVRGVVFPAVLELNGYDANVPYAGLSVDIGRRKVVAVGIPRNASDFSFVPVACTLELTVPYERAGDVGLVD
jgi:hypothetical protein